MNVELALKVKQHILEHPEQADMNHWQSDCGTTACIAGWTILLGYGKPGERLDDVCDRFDADHERIDGYEEIACALLGLPVNNGLINTLFYSSGWDDPEYDLYFSDPTPENSHPKAAAMAARIDRLIAEHGHSKTFSSPYEEMAFNLGVLDVE